jgi:hypothetical protein
MIGGGCSRDAEAYVILCQITAEQSAERRAPKRCCDNSQSSIESDITIFDLLPIVDPPLFVREQCLSSIMYAHTYKTHQRLDRQSLRFP